MFEKKPCVAAEEDVVSVVVNSHYAMSRLTRCLGSL